MSLDKYVEDCKKTDSAFLVLVDGDKVIHSPIDKGMLKAPGGLETIVKGLIVMMYGNTNGSTGTGKCVKCSGGSKG